MLAQLQRISSVSFQGKPPSISKPKAPVHHSESNYSSYSLDKTYYFDILTAQSWVVRVAVTQHWVEGFEAINTVLNNKPHTGNHMLGHVKCK
jgi:hypothetical protein